MFVNCNRFHTFFIPHYSLKNKQKNKKTLRKTEFFAKNYLFSLFDIHTGSCFVRFEFCLLPQNKLPALPQ